MMISHLFIRCERRTCNESWLKLMGEKKTKKPRGNPAPAFVVGVGASAGGLGAFAKLLQNLPDDTGMAFVLIQHLDPHHPSILSDLLARDTNMPIAEATDGMEVAADHIYVIPPNSNMAIYHGSLNLLKRDKPPARHLAVDYFLKTLARDQGSQAIGVILSGTASDGAVGIAAIKAANGITFAQDPESAEYDGMPQAAINSGAVDFVGSPEDIAKQVVKIASHPYGGRLDAVTEEKVLGQGDEEYLKKVFIILRNSTGTDFSLYKRSTIERRILRRMVLHKIDKLPEYVEYMIKTSGEAENLFQDILISVTEFFRDPETFDVLKHKVYPRIAEFKDADEPWRLWVPGCSTGEESFSIAISLLEFLREASIGSPIQIFATDLNPKAIGKARSAFYPTSALEGVSADRLQRYFDFKEGGYQVKHQVREMCVFAKHDITRDPPFSHIDFISFRNVLIYLDSVLQKRVIPYLHYSLEPWGYLMLGASEGVGGFSDLMDIVDKKYKIFAKKAHSGRIPTGLGALSNPARLPEDSGLRFGLHWSNQ